MSRFDAHFRYVASRLAHGTVVPLLGAGANLCDRTGEWTQGVNLPTARELSAIMAREFEVPRSEAADLSRASLWVELKWGPGALYDWLHALFDRDLEPTSLHALLASLPAWLPFPDGRPRPLLIVTTNYDDLLERAFDAAGQPYDVLVYMARGAEEGRMVHYRRGGASELIEQPSRYQGVSLLERSVILKLHGNVDRGGPGDSYVITEDDYLEYLANSSDLGALVPALVKERLVNSHFLFLGYSLSDWNVRVMLHRLWRERNGRDYRSWAVQLKPNALDTELWAREFVDVYRLRLSEYVAGLSARLPALAGVEA